MSLIWNRGTPFSKNVLSDISLEIPSGQFVALLGPSGAGKSLFAQVVGGLRFPDRGSVTVGSFRISKTNKQLHRLRKSIGFVFQQPEHQLVRETVEEDIALRLSPYDASFPPELESRVELMMERLGLPYGALRHRSPFRLSPGQMRRIALAGALIGQPELLLLDEPAAGLDPAGREAMLTCVKELHESRKTTIIYITQRLEEALEHADRIVVFNKGTIAADLAPPGVPDHMSELYKAEIVATPLLKFAERLYSVAPGLVPRHFVQERAFLMELAKQIRRKE
ncbi:ATP-binding cassette domain-containing protein [Paenibacillus sp. GYB004]|uniref:ATP-binding cassette domain-containing protein n=1 Tax=Paenibacillus sp. GYB004 TaxID=2994393 RepID=UPI002F9636A4